jgi:hypothetical protein
MTKSKNKPIVKLDINKLIAQSNDIENFNPILALVLVLDKLIDNFETKDVIPKNLAKPYALLSSTNKVQKDLINELIAKQNDNKGNVKKMYMNIITNTLKSIRYNPNENEKTGIISKLLHR